MPLTSSCTALLCVPYYWAVMVSLSNQYLESASFPSYLISDLLGVLVLDFGYSWDVFSFLRYVNVLSFSPFSSYSFTLF